jgi:membrane fusion protein (multidrug efflux system)
VVPEDAILPLQGAEFVWVVQEGRAVRRQVRLGVRTRGWVEVVEGVAAAEQVVVGGLERLQEGAPVQVTVVERGETGDTTGGR